MEGPMNGGLDLTPYCRVSLWFAWYPVRLGTLGRGGWAWLETVWRSTCQGATVYAPSLPEVIDVMLGGPAVQR
jgi:hypothetical protein